MWFYNSPIGIWVIRLNNSGRYELWLNDNCYGSYHSAISAADDVFTHHTGCYEWDELHFNVSAPTDIYEWNKVK